MSYIICTIFVINAIYTTINAIASHRWILLSWVENINPSVAIIKNGIPICIAVGDTVSVPMNAGIPETASALKVFDPKIFPSAIACFPALAAWTDIMSSGRDVPMATANIVTIEEGIESISERV